MTGNVSKIKREELLGKIQQIKTFIESSQPNQNTANLLSYLGELVKEINGKKYGLVFEEHREAIDEKLDMHTPVLTEMKDLYIDNGGEQNFLIEGDNLAALKLLEKTHRGKIDVIYIDPPYNTGNKDDFIYNDKLVEINDSFKHSKWISFMKKRLEFARTLLTNSGVIFISINDFEQSPLKLLCDEIFGEQNFIALFLRLTTKSGKTPSTFMQSHDYVCCYVKKDTNIFIGDAYSDNSYKYKDEFFEERGFYNLKQPLDCNSIGYSKSLDYPIEYNGKIYYAGGSKDKYEERQKGIHKKKDYAWRWSKDLYDFGLKNGWIVFSENDRIYTKGYLNAKIEKVDGIYKIIYSEKTRKKSTIDFIKNDFSNDIAKKQLASFYLNDKFDYPKPYTLIQNLISSHFNKDAIILDFFAGSGTTGHAVLKLNAEDGGHRKFILCTNNENNICKDITYQRLKTVITGKRQDGSDYEEKMVNVLYEHEIQINDLKGKSGQDLFAEIDEIKKEEKNNYDSFETKIEDNAIKLIGQKKIKSGYPASLKYFEIEDIPICDKLYYEYADDLLKHIRELVELENAINFDTDKTLRIVLSDDELEEFIQELCETSHSSCVNKLFVGHDVLLSAQQERILNDNNITVITIPDYYYGELCD